VALDTCTWLRNQVLPPFLEPGEQVATIGLSELEDILVAQPDKSVYRVLSQMRDFRGRPLELKHSAFIILTTHRVIFAPGSPGTGKAPLSVVYGLITVRWHAVREVFVPKKMVQKHFLNLVVKHPNLPGQPQALKFAFWHKEDGVSEHEDFVARAGLIAQERCAAAKAAGFAEPPIYFELTSNQMATDQPERVAQIQANHAAPATVTASGAKILWGLAAALALPGLWFFFVAMSHGNPAGMLIGGVLLGVAALMIRKALQPKKG